MWSAAQLDPLHIATVISLSVFLLLFLAARSLQTWGAVRRRAMNIGPRFGPAVGGGLRAGGSDRAARLMARLEGLLAPSQREALTQIRRQLVQAGFFSAPAVAAFYGSRILLAVTLPVALLAFMGLLPIKIPGALLMILTACVALLGLILPSVALDIRIRYM